MALVEAPWRRPSHYGSHETEEEEEGHVALEFLDLPGGPVRASSGCPASDRKG
jgi:hypothetical protein